MDLNDELLTSDGHHRPDDSSVHTPKVFDRYFSSSSSSSDDESQLSNSSMAATSKRLDYMIQFLDRKLSTSSYSNRNNSVADPADNDDYNSNRNKSSALPEFIGKGGGTGIFRLPVRGAVHPGRPPCLEVRPHLLRESQIGCSLRTLTTTETQLWTGSDNGAVQVWQFKDLYGGCGDSAPHKESVALGSGVMCVVGDEGSRVVWSGHRDGKVRCWKMDFCSDRFREVLSWVAHSGPILTMIITKYGQSILFPFAASLGFLHSFATADCLIATFFNSVNPSHP